MARAISLSFCEYFSNRFFSDIVLSLNSLMKAYPTAAVLTRSALDHQLATFYQSGLIPLQVGLDKNKLLP